MKTVGTRRGLPQQPLLYFAPPRNPDLHLLTGMLWTIAFVVLLAGIKAVLRSRTQHAETPQAVPLANHAAPAPARHGDVFGPKASQALLRAAGVPELFAVDRIDRVAALLSLVFGGDAGVPVLFRHGTVVLIAPASPSPCDDASELLGRVGLAIPGGPGGDFGTLELTQKRGWLVTCHHGKIFTYISPMELPGAPRPNIEIGLIGRAKRHLDAIEQEVVSPG